MVSFKASFLVKFSMPVATSTCRHLGTASGVRLRVLLRRLVQVLLAPSGVSSKSTLHLAWSGTRNKL